MNDLSNINSTSRHSDIEEHNKKYVIVIHLKQLIENEKINNNSINKDQLYKDFFIRKSLYDITMFNKKLLSIFNEKFNEKSSKILQLKNITDIFNSSNISSGILKSKIKSLQGIYSSLSHNYLFFVNEFIQFLNVNDTKHQSEFGKLISIESNQKEDPFNAETDNDDIAKISNFINCILTNSRFIKIIINELVKRKNILTFECQIIFKEHNKQSSNIEYINYTDLNNYINSVKNISPFSKSRMLINLQHIINGYKLDPFDNEINSSYNKLLSKALTEFSNDLLFLDTAFFKIFNLNNFLVIITEIK